jgi:ribulose-phosphate 3-epimerase
MQVIPAILPKSYDELLGKFERVKDFHNLLQIDLVDGTAGGERTWLPKPNEDMSTFPEHEFQFDLMIQDWRNISFGLAALMKVHSFIFHIDSFTDEEVQAISSWCASKGVECCFSIGNDTAIDVLFNALYLVRESNRSVFVQVMGIHTIGLQGQLFDEVCLSRIRKLRENFGDLFIQVDGAMRPETARKVKDAGANAVVVGSYLFGREEMSLPLEELAAI